jgi:hypothetical protein
MIDTGSVATQDCQLQIQINGTAISISNPPMAQANGQGMGFSATVIYTCAANDAIRCTFYTNATSSQDKFYGGGGRFNNFCGFLIG